jgi:hypothetical protein
MRLSVKVSKTRIELASEGEICVQRWDLYRGLSKRLKREENRVCGLGIPQGPKGNT